MDSVVNHGISLTYLDSGFYVKETYNNGELLKTVYYNNENNEVTENQLPAEKSTEISFTHKNPTGVSYYISHLSPIPLFKKKDLVVSRKKLKPIY